MEEARFVFDSNVRDMSIKRMRCWYPKEGVNVEIPEELIKEFSLQVKVAGSDTWEEISYCEDNFQRLVKIPVQRKVSAVRFVPEASWGCQEARIFAFDLR